jgi:hypothetical protein
VLVSLSALVFPSEVVTSAVSAVCSLVQYSRDHWTNLHMAYVGRRTVALLTGDHVFKSAVGNRSSRGTYKHV